MIKIGKNKKGVSAVVGVTLMVALVVGLVAIVWIVVTNVVQDELSGAESCFGNFDKVKINNRYTCLDDTNEQLNFSISVGDINVSEIVVTISGGGEIKTIRLDRISEYSFAKNFRDTTYGEKLVPPEESSGKTYSINISDPNFGITTIESIEIAPKIGKNQCEVSDSLLTIDPCKSKSYV